MKTLRVHYEGRVQGVGFRYTVKNLAREFEVSGTVANLPDGRVELKCSPELEARNFESGNIHDTWDQLGQLSVPTWLVSGRIGDIPPASLIPSIASTIAETSAITPTVIEWQDLGHFGPLEDPARFASLLIEVSEAVR